VCGLAHSFALLLILGFKQTTAHALHVNYETLVAEW